MNLHSTLRKLAKSDYYQTLYSHAKELHLKLFKNDTDFTEIQIKFLYYLGLYSIINMDIYLNEVSERVLENEIFEDAYVVYKNKKNKSKEKITEQPMYERRFNNKKSQKFSWVFRK